MEGTWWSFGNHISQELELELGSIILLRSVQVEDGPKMDILGHEPSFTLISIV